MLDDESQGEYGTVLDQIKLAREDAEERRDRMEYLEKEAARLKEEYEEALARLKAEEERKGADIGLKIRGKLQNVLQDAEKLHDALRHTHKSVAKRVRSVLNGIRGCLNDLEALLEGHEPERELEAGDEVYVIKLHKWGTVRRVDKKNGRLAVDVGGMQVDVSEDDIQPWGETQ
jgi:dsDNA-specific endonuclease/ATPase MutS2